MAQITKTKYVHPEVLVDTQWVEEHLDDKQGSTAQFCITVSNQYYDKKNCRFVLCDACFWFATILKNLFKLNQCPRCKKNKLIFDKIAIC
jgi:hypothetical protein